MRSDATTPQGSSPGRVLATAREARGMTVNDIAVRLKFSQRQIEALENDRYELLPIASIARGMARSYAKLVGVEPAPLLAMLDSHLRRGPDTVSPATIGVPLPRKPRRGSFAYVVLSGAILVAVVGVLIQWWMPVPTPPAVAVDPTPTAPPPPAPPPAVAAPVPAETAPVTPPAPVAPSEPAIGPSRIDLAFEEECWVEIRDGSGEILLSELSAPGTRRRIEGIAPFSVVIGNAAGVKMRYNDAAVDLAPYTRIDVARLTLQ